MRFTNVNLMDELDRPELSAVRSIFREASFPAGTFIAHPESDSDLSFVVRSGRVRVFLAYEDKEFTLTHLARGDLFSTHSGTYVQAVEPTRVLITSVESIRHCLVTHPEFALTTVHILGNILRNAFSIIGNLAFKDISKRLADLLLEQAETAGEPDPGGGVRISLDMNMEQLGLMVGSTRQTASTLINAMVHDGDLVKLGRGSYLVPDLGRLRRRAEG